MTEAIRGAAQHGRLYWCVKTDLAADGEIHIMADRIEVASSGALIAWGSFRANEGEARAEPSVNLVCAPGRWSAAYLASTVDGGGLAIQNWAGEPAHGRGRAANAEQSHGLREVPHEPR